MHRDVISLIDAEFPEHAEVARQAYGLKRSDGGRMRAREMVADHRTDARALARRLLELWRVVCAQSDEVILSGHSLLPLLECGWKEANWEIYLDLLVQDGAA